MVNGTVFIRGSGTVNLTAANNVALAKINTTNSAINAAADSDLSGAGAITDNNSNLISTGQATLSAATGIGSASKISTNIGTPVATNSTSGDNDAVLLQCPRHWCSGRG